MPGAEMSFLSLGTYGLIEGEEKKDINMLRQTSVLAQQKARSVDTDWL